MNLGVFDSPESVIAACDSCGYLADDELATALFLAYKLGKPLLLEGHPGVGKTEVANVLAKALDTNLIRLQCYEGLDVNSAVYEWNYQKQLLSIRIAQNGNGHTGNLEKHIFGKDFLLKRPLLQSITQEKSPVLLIDEVDRADEEFEAFLLELLSAYQISIPEMGTIEASKKPIVILTSNRTRELSDALKRRCLYIWNDFPDFEKEMNIVKKHHPHIEESLVRQVIHAIQYLREQKLTKYPGISESIDWASALLAIGTQKLDRKSIEKTLSCVLKAVDDVDKMKNGELERMLGELATVI
ncbi:MAG: MoxR family ATPase [Bacteroidia bacterium]|nr:MoxR family ATPase [Bacteroidia bacterium]